MSGAPDTAIGSPRDHRARYRFGWKIQRRRRYDWDAQAYFLRAELAGSSLSGAERSNVSAFVRGLKDVGAWESLVEGWTLRAGQNLGTGSVALGLKGVNGTLVNGPTWGANGITSVGAASSVDVALPINGTDVQRLTLFFCYRAPQGNVLGGFATVPTSGPPYWWTFYHNWWNELRNGWGLYNNSAAWVSTMLGDSAGYTETGFQAQQLTYRVGAAPSGLRNGQAAYGFTYGNAQAPFAAATSMTGLRLGDYQASGFTSAFFGFFLADVPNLYALYRRTIGQGLGLP